MDYELRPIVDEEVPAFRGAVSMGFGGDANPLGNDRFMALLPRERTVAVFDDGEIVGTLGDFPMVLTVPGGGQLAMAGTTMVGVRATHTRRGILRAMVRRHLDNAVERGEAIAGLWASEAAIYERFGFGQAIEFYDTRVDTRGLGLPAVADDLDVVMIRPDQVAELVVPFWSQIATSRSGFLERTAERWQDIVNDLEYMREGTSARRHVIVRRGADVVGYLDYTQREKWNDMVADGTIEIGTLVAADIDAHRALWAYALDVDLFPTTHFWNGAIDDTLAYDVDNARAVRRTVCDGLYVRILDVPRALQTRSYEVDGAITIKVDDDMGYAGATYELVVAGGTATVTPMTTAPDVSVAIRDLGALYLGRHCVDGYAATGRIRGDAGKVRLLGQIFATARAPWCPEMF